MVVKSTHVYLCFGVHGGNQPTFHKLKMCLWSHPFCYVSDMMTVEGERCPMLHNQHFDRYECTTWLLIVLAFSHKSQCKCTHVHKVASTELSDLRHNAGLLSCSLSRADPFPHRHTHSDLPKTNMPIWQLTTTSNQQYDLLSGIFSTVVWTINWCIRHKLAEVSKTRCQENWQENAALSFA